MWDLHPYFYFSFSSLFLFAMEVLHKDKCCMGFYNDWLGKHVVVLVNS